MKKILLIFLFFVFLFPIPYTLYPSYAEGLNVASTYEIDDKDAIDGDIIVSSSGKGLTRTNVSYDSRTFGVLQDKPLVVYRDQPLTKKPIIRLGDAVVNVTDFNGDIKKGDYVTSSPALGKGMKAGQSGYVLGIALSNVSYSNNTVNLDNKNYKLGKVDLAVRIEYAELSTARSNLRLLTSLNEALFRNIQDPEKFTVTLRYLIAGLIAILAFAIGFFSVSRSVSKAVEAVGRNPLAKNSIYASVVLQIVLTIVGAIATFFIIYVIIRL